ncbi:MAG: DUF1629 domain-containing protein [Pseudomonadota bacterium]|nr:DUF1629 domain-containing protein [Pseudomonadota bacterium]
MNKLQKEAAANTPEDYRERIAMLTGSRFSWDTKLSVQFSDGTSNYHDIISPQWEQTFDSVEECESYKLSRVPKNNRTGDLVSIKIGKKRFKPLDYHLLAYGGLVSEKLKNLLSNWDSDAFFFTSIDFLAWDGSKFGSEPYYYMTIRNYVDFSAPRVDIKQSQLPAFSASGFALDPLDIRHYVALHKNKTLYDRLKSLGLCAVYFTNDKFFMSNDLLQEIRRNEISGFDVKTLNKDELKGGTVVYV